MLTLHQQYQGMVNEYPKHELLSTFYTQERLFFYYSPFCFLDHLQCQISGTPKLHSTLSLFKCEGLAVAK